MIIHDTECPYRDQVSLNNTNPNSAMVLHTLIFQQENIFGAIVSCGGEDREVVFSEIPFRFTPSG